MKSNIHEHISSSVITAGKKVFFIVAIFAILFVQKISAQDNQAQPSQLLTSYYGVKNALSADNASAASASAAEFLKAANGVGTNTIAQDKLAALQKDAGAIEQMKDIKRQREHFASLSANMLDVVKATKLTTQPVYALYCPMKKSYWLSSDKTVKNPYFGKAMPTCGKVSETINQ